MKRKALILAIMLQSVINVSAQITISVPSSTSIDTTLGEVFSEVDVDASFPGGEPAFLRYLRNNLDLDVPIKNKVKTGQYNVIVKFIVSKSGALSGIQPVTNYGFGMEEEIIRVIKKGPKWTPGIKDGRNVNSYYKQTVTFNVP